MTTPWLEIFPLDYIKIYLFPPSSLSCLKCSLFLILATRLKKKKSNNNVPSGKCLLNHESNDIRSKNISFFGISVEKFDSIEYIYLESKWGCLSSSQILQEHLFPWIPVLLHELNLKDPEGPQAICHVAQTEMLLPLGVSRSNDSLRRQESCATLGEWDAITHNEI